MAARAAQVARELFGEQRLHFRHRAERAGLVRIERAVQATRGLLESAVVPTLAATLHMILTHV